jgi:hypothetical protein
MPLWRHLARPPWRTSLLFVVILGAIGLACLAWSPGKRVLDGRHDLRSNGIWLQHGWLGDDSWFRRNRKNKERFRSGPKIQELADLLAGHGVKHVFPHVCPCDPSGKIAPVDPAQTERFLDHFGGFRVVPWIGGVYGSQCFPESPQWRAAFASSAADLLRKHPRLAGVHVNIEPMPSGNADFLILLDDLRRAMPKGKMLSVAAYPPPTFWQHSLDVHWEEPYFRQVAWRVDQVVPMMYDTAIMLPKLYRHLMIGWTTEALNWAGNAQVLLGVPAYDDAGVGYHSPKVENLRNALMGIHAGLNKAGSLPRNYAGVAIYCEWEMDKGKWDDFKKEFERH